MFAGAGMKWGWAVLVAIAGVLGLAVLSGFVVGLGADCLKRIKGGPQ